jgi:hypothetical protein
MSQTESETPHIAVEPEHPPVELDSVAAFLKENCRKQEEAIQAIENSAYVTRRGRRELQDPKRLALAIELRRKHMANVVEFAARIRDGESAVAYVRELYEIVVAELAGSSELSRRVGLRIGQLNKKFDALRTNR